MKKIITIFILLACILTGIIYIMTKNYSSGAEEVNYSVLTSYSYLTEDSLKIKLYSNTKKSHLSYPDKASYLVHDKENKNLLELNFKSFEAYSFNDSDSTYYEYDILLNVEMESSIEIPEAYLKVSFEDGYYDFLLGSFQIQEENTDILSYDLLYGLTDSKNNNSLAGVVININSDKSFVIYHAYIGGNKVNMNRVSYTDKGSSTDIYDYVLGYSKKDYYEKSFSFEKNNGPIILPIYYEDNYYVSEAYILLETSIGNFVIPTFEYAIESGFSNQKSLLKEGTFYEYSD